MKITIELAREDVLEAIRAHLKAMGYVVNDVKLLVEEDRDYVDQPTGGYAVSAVAKVENHKNDPSLNRIAQEKGSKWT